ncbi:MAG TPA: hypothetical protein VHM91_13085 [Verrucomicrobiales bacterium]|nr:hypothetical protein [Verrucomicrobiales bacterium]
MVSFLTANRCGLPVCAKGTGTRIGTTCVFVTRGGGEATGSAHAGICLLVINKALALSETFIEDFLN